jgi:hypothetical protein
MKDKEKEQKLWDFMMKHTSVSLPDLLKLLRDVGVEGIGKEQPKGRWKPENDGEYWIISQGGEVETDGRWYADKYDLIRYNIGNCYRTKEEAEHARDKQLALVELSDLAEGYKFDVGYINYYIVFDGEVNKFQIRDCQHTRFGTTYFKTQEQAQHAIDVMGDKLKSIMEIS